MWNICFEGTLLVVFDEVTIKSMQCVETKTMCGQSDIKSAYYRDA